MRHLALSALIALLFFSCRQTTVRLENYAVHGLDVSHYQSHIDWPLVAAQDIDFTFIKATEGYTMEDTLYCSNWLALRETGITRGAYHFFRPTLDAHVQAQNFISSVILEPGDLPPVLDAEVLDGVTPEVLRRQLHRWIDVVRAHYQVDPILYTNLNFYNDHLAGYFPDQPLWLARYHQDGPRASDDRDWHFWQYGNRGRIDGIDGDVDFNVFYGSYDQLLDLTIAPPVVLSMD